MQIKRAERFLAVTAEVIGQPPDSGVERSAVSNAAEGAQLEEVALRALRTLTGIEFERQVDLSIPTQPKGHCFDFASPNRAYVGECKAYSFTTGGNIPNAKITGLRDAVRVLQQLPHGTKRFIVMRRSLRPRHPESLAEYFARTDATLIGDVCILETSDDGEVRIISGHLV